MPLTNLELAEIYTTLVRPICRRICGRHNDLELIECNILSTLWFRSRNLANRTNVRGWIVTTIYQEAKKQLSLLRKKALPQSEDHELAEVACNNLSGLDLLCEAEKFEIAAKHQDEMERIRASEQRQELGKSKAKRLLRTHKKLIERAIAS
jgi:hypothetical protein